MQQIHLRSDLNHDKKPLRSSIVINRIIIRATTMISQPY